MWKLHGCVRISKELGIFSSQNAPVWYVWLEKTFERKLGAVDMLLLR